LEYWCKERPEQGKAGIVLKTVIPTFHEKALCTTNLRFLEILLSMCHDRLSNVSFYPRISQIIGI